ncbi:MAG: 2-dehydropantoate 2-reductase [Methylobacteriaceae bacterium]|nr:2-dehydropantoate 2-reductase [Methylobacteriaceae bacterium]
MKLCIYGAGAIGGLLGARLARAGEEVTLIARGPHLEAVCDRGLRLVGQAEDFTVHPHATSDPSEAGAQDFVIVTLKAQAVAGVVDQMQPLFGPETAVVMAVNGLPWWYFHGVEGPFRDHQLASVDPAGRQWQGIGAGRVIGCVVYPAAEVAEPGVVRHITGDRFTLGEPDGRRSARIEALSRVLIAAGFRAPIKSDIRNEIWVKLWGNAAFNPISALTGATMRQMCEDPGTQALIRKIMGEVQAIASRLGIEMPISIERRLEGAAAVGEHKTSMLQDLERGRPMEIDAIVGAAAELGDLVDFDTPMIDAVLALVRQRARLAGIST